MNLLNAIHQDTTLEAPADLDLDLREVMLDLDPGMLAWTPPRTRLVRKGDDESVLADAPLRTL